jgi:sulfate permease, SulP family
VLLTLLVLAPLFSQLPKAVLAAVIIDAVVFGMIDVGEFKRLRRVARFDFVIALAALVGVLSSGVLFGVVIGMALSLLWLIHVVSMPPMPLVGEPVAGVTVLRLDSGLFFATAEALEERVRALEPRVLVLDCRGINFIDSQGAEKLSELQGTLAADGATLRLAQVKPRVRAVLMADGFAGELYGTLDLAVRGAAARTPV